MFDCHLLPVYASPPGVRTGEFRLTWKYTKYLVYPSKTGNKAKSFPGRQRGSEGFSEQPYYTTNSAFWLVGTRQKFPLTPLLSPDIISLDKRPYLTSSRKQQQKPPLGPLGGFALAIRFEANSQKQGLEALLVASTVSAHPGKRLRSFSRI